MRSPAGCASTVPMVGPSNKTDTMIRVIVYVDGFNLYNGLREKHGHRYLWLDLQRLSSRLLLPGQELAEVRYFSARVRGREPSRRRQSVHLDALAAGCDLVRITEGRFQQKHRECGRCGAVTTGFEEKETDVNIASALIEDAATDRFDTAVLISGDSDLCPAVRAVARLAPTKRVVAAFPPKRSSEELRRVCRTSFTISDAKIRQSLLPDLVVTTAGIALRRPDRWR